MYADDVVILTRSVKELNVIFREYTALRIGLDINGKRTKYETGKNWVSGKNNFNS